MVKLPNFPCEISQLHLLLLIILLLWTFVFVVWCSFKGV